MKTNPSKDFIMNIIPNDGGMLLENKRTKKNMTINKITIEQSVAIAADVFDLSYDDANAVILETLGAAIVRGAARNILAESYK